MPRKSTESGPSGAPGVGDGLAIIPKFDSSGILEQRLQADLDYFERKAILAVPKWPTNFFNTSPIFSKALNISHEQFVDIRMAVIAWKMLDIQDARNRPINRDTTISAWEARAFAALALRAKPFLDASHIHWQRVVSELKRDLGNASFGPIIQQPSFYRRSTGERVRAGAKATRRTIAEVLFASQGNKRL